MARFQATVPEANCDHELIVRELPYLRRFARSLAADAIIADDLVHDCVVKALENTDKFEPGTNLRAWLFTILRNCFISDIRRNRRRLSTMDGPRWAVGGISPPNQDDAVALRRLQGVLARLPEDQRTLLLLVALDGASYEAAAARLGIPIGTVRSRLSRARSALRRAWEGEECLEGWRCAAAAPAGAERSLTH